MILHNILSLFLCIPSISTDQPLATVIRQQNGDGGATVTCIAVGNERADFFSWIYDQRYRDNIDCSKVLPKICQSRYIGLQQMKLSRNYKPSGIFNCVGHTSRGSLYRYEYHFSNQNVNIPSVNFIDPGNLYYGSDVELVANIGTHLDAGQGNVTITWLKDDVEVLKFAHDFIYEMESVTISELGNELVGRGETQFFDPTNQDDWITNGSEYLNSLNGTMFDCNSETYMKNVKKNSTDNRFSSWIHRTKVYLAIRNVDLSDSVVYKLIIDYSGTSISGEIRLQILSAPAVNMYQKQYGNPYQDSIHYYGRVYEVVCNVSSATTFHVTLKWVSCPKNEMLDACQDSLTNNINTGEIVDSISNASKRVLLRVSKLATISGHFVCIGVNQLGEDRQIVPFRVIERDTIEPTSKPYDKERGMNLTYSCVMTKKEHSFNTKDMKWSWKLDGEDLEMKHQKINISISNSTNDGFTISSKLVILQPDPKIHGGNLTCSLRNSSGVPFLTYYRETLMRMLIHFL